MFLLLTPLERLDAEDSEEAPNVELVLAVNLNDKLSPLLWQATLLPDGSLAMTRDRLRQLGLDVDKLKVPQSQTLVPLSSLAGVRYRYSVARQSVDIEAPDSALVPVVLDDFAAPEPLDLSRIETNDGAVLNYQLFAAGSRDGLRGAVNYDFRFVTGAGVFTNDGLINWFRGGENRLEHIRLDTRWRYIDIKRVLVATLGDAIGDGGQLASAYRFGGIQIRRNYTERSDLVAVNLPVFTATAAVPSVVDLYINGLRYYQGEVGRGPFEFRSLPNIGRGATATVVLRDATGKETRISKPIFFVSDLLPPGRFEFSVEGGFPRRNFGFKSNDYYKDLAGSATVRYGVADWVTVTAHGEGKKGLINAGIGAITRLGGIGALTLGVAGSRYQGRTAFRRIFDLQFRVAAVNVYATIERASEAYRDIVSALPPTRRYSVRPRTDDPDAGTYDPTEPTLLAFSRRLERVGVDFTVRKTGFNLNYSRARLSGDEVRVASGSVYRPINRNVTVWTNGYRDFAGERGWGVYGGVSLILNRRTTASASVSRSSRGTSISTRFTRRSTGEPGSIGLVGVNNQYLGHSSLDYRALQLRYPTRFATLEGGVEHYGGAAHILARAEGAIVAMDGIYLSPPVETSFAVVTGAGADTPVFSNFRRVGKTNKDGRALIPNLVSLDENVISIDPTELPVDLRPARTSVTVIPSDLGGVKLDFGVKAEMAAVIILVGPDGNPLPLGTQVSYGNQKAAVGYDGRTYLTGLAASNIIHAYLPDGKPCTAGFDFAPIAGQQVQIGPVTCQ